MNAKLVIVVALLAVSSAYDDADALGVYQVPSQAKFLAIQGTTTKVEVKTV